MKEEYIPRKLEKEIQRNINTKEIIAIVGPRQAGKTTLIKHIYKQLKNAIFLDFEDQEDLNLFTNDIKAFAELHIKNKDYLFIDEFQYAKEGGKHLKYIFDNHKIKIFISGSSVIGLAQESLRYLVGRVFLFNLYPLSFEEMLQYKDKNLYGLFKEMPLHSEEINNMLKKYYSEFIQYGGYPRVILASKPEEKETILKNIYNIYILQEIKGILNIKDEYKLTRIMHALALQIGNIINYNELCTLTSNSYTELLESIQVMQKTYVLAECRPYYNNKRTELVKAPKSFFIDTGFRNAIIKNFQPLRERPDQGALYENSIASELLKNGQELRYWRTKAKAEIDFIIEKNSKIIPIEVKIAASGSISKSLHSFIDKYRPLQGALVSLDIRPQKQIGNIKIIPPWMLPSFLSRKEKKR